MSESQRDEKPKLKISRARTGNKKTKDLFAVYRDEHPLDDAFKAIESLQNVVNHTEQDRLTTVVNHRVELLTTETPENVNKLTTPENVVNHKTETRLTRDYHLKVVEGFRMDKELKRQVKVFCAEKGIDKQEFYEIVVNHYFECVVNQITDGAVNKLTHDDRDKTIMYKTSSLIINIYLKYNPENKWKYADDAIAHKFNDADIRLIETAIIKTKLTAGKRINSFKYFVVEIEEYLSLNLDSGTVDAMLASALRRWNREGN